MDIMDDDELSTSFFGTTTPTSVNDLVDVNPPLSGSFLVDNLNIGNPWDPPSTLKGAETSNILADVVLPEIYSTAFNLAHPSAGRIPISALNKILGVSGQPHNIVEKIVNLTVPSSTRVNQGEFNTALALVALAQKHMDVSIENLISRKEDLPEPILPNLENINFRSASFGNLAVPSISPPTSAPLEADPWAMPSTSTSISTNPIPSVPTLRISDETTPYPESSSAATEITFKGSYAHKGEFQWCLDMDSISVKFAPEREGFLFKHVNYIVESQVHGVKALRRYSDFWWLMECLVKKYPFRILPSLPPKKIGVNGFYFTVDESFLEKRRKGLTRFLNFIARHPVLKDDELFSMFLTEQQEIALWRKTNTPDLEEEFLKKHIPIEIERRIPHDLDERLKILKIQLTGAIEHYRNMCHIMERIARRREGTSTDYMRYGLALNSLIESEKGCDIEDGSNCSQVVSGLTEVSTHVQRASAIIEEEAVSTLENVLENLKRHRDLLVSFRETLERRDRIATDTTATLNTRIASNEAKLPLSGKEDVDKLSAAIQKDKEDIDLQQKRRIFVRHCLNAELSLYHKSSMFISLLYQNFAQEQLKFSQQLYENWKALSRKVLDMPVQTNDCPIHITKERKN
ncbi:hypothetical protein G9A89_018792 [Geosiphon pyriformis]|nr:hypothetical protein G9A89_018792 [Geosiphon pyriformis]